MQCSEIVVIPAALAVCLTDTQTRMNANFLRLNDNKPEVIQVAAQAILKKMKHISLAWCHIILYSVI